MTTVFDVVGTDRDNPDTLVLLGDDGQFYRWVLALGPPTPITPEELSLDLTESTPLPAEVADWLR